jgi:hypothetical protein
MCKKVAFKPCTYLMSQTRTTSNAAKHCVLLCSLNGAKLKQKQMRLSLIRMHLRSSHRSALSAGCTRLLGHNSRFNKPDATMSHCPEKPGNLLG